MGIGALGIVCPRQRYDWARRCNSITKTVQDRIIAARYAQGWNYPASSVPATHDGSFEEFLARRDALFRACDRVGRDPATITISVQLRAGDDTAARKATIPAVLDYVREGCTHMILTMPAKFGADGLREIAEQVVTPLRDAGV